jgi:3D (Asp-Asp-Asp) domain-containing protein
MKNKNKIVFKKDTIGRNRAYRKSKNGLKPLPISEAIVVKRETKTIKQGILILSVFCIGVFVIGAYGKQTEAKIESYTTPQITFKAYKGLPIAKDKPKAELIEPVRVVNGAIREITMYTSTPEQTDSSPCIGATGENQCELFDKGINICASNAYKFGTVIKIDKLGECIVKDRMNRRYKNRIDWYAGYDSDCLNGVHKGDDCPNYRRAVNFGLQRLNVK